MVYLKSKIYQGDSQDLSELKRDIKGEVRGISRETNCKVLEGSKQSYVTQEKVGFSSTCCSGGEVERGGAGPVLKKFPKNVLCEIIQ